MVAGRRRRGRVGGTAKLHQRRSRRRGNQLCDRTVSDLPPGLEVTFGDLWCFAALPAVSCDRGSAVGFIGAGCACVRAHVGAHDGVALLLWTFPCLRIFLRLCTSEFVAFLPGATVSRGHARRPRRRPRTQVRVRARARVQTLQR